MGERIWYGNAQIVVIFIQIIFLTVLHAGQELKTISLKSTKKELFNLKNRFCTADICWRNAKKSYIIYVLFFIGLVDGSEN